MSVYLDILGNYEHLTKSERKVAKFCLDNYIEIENYTLANLAKVSDCGEATIFRFCQKNGFETFLDFKNAIKEEIHSNIKLNEKTFVDDIYQSVQESIENVISNLEIEEIEKIAKVINESRKVICIGAGNSGIPAEACAMRFLRNGKDALYLKDNNFQLIYLYQMDENDCAILFSASGEAWDTIYCADILQKRGIKIIAITGSVVSTLAKMSDYHILSRKVDGPLGAGSMISQITLIYLADVITTRVAMFDQKSFMKAKESTYEYVYHKSKHW